MKSFLLVFFVLLSYGCANNYYFKNNVKVFIIPYTLNSDSDIDYYKDEKGNILGVSNKIIIKIKESEAIENIIDFQFIDLKNLGKNLYLLEIEDKSKTIDLANELNENELVEYAYPDFIRRKFGR